MRNFKKMAGYSFILLLFGGLLFAVGNMYWSFFLTPEKEAVDHYVIEKQSNKGLYLTPLYQVITDDDSHTSYVSKKAFDRLEVGDKVSGYKTSKYGFFTKTDQLYEGSLLLILFFTIGFVFLLLLVTIILSIPAIKRRMAEKEAEALKNSKDENVKPKKKWLGILVLIIIIPMIVAFCSIYTWNLFHKLIPINQTTATAEIVKVEGERKVTSRGDLSNYQLTVDFTAEDGDSYRVRKGVTKHTFQNYRSGDPIEISYRNKNPYDIFMKTGDFLSVFYALMHISTLLYLISILILYYFGRRMKRIFFPSTKREQ